MHLSRRGGRQSTEFLFRASREERGIGRSPRSSNYVAKNGSTLHSTGDAMQAALRPVYDGEMVRVRETTRLSEKVTIPITTHNGQIIQLP